MGHAARRLEPDDLDVKVEVTEEHDAKEPEEGGSWLDDYVTDSEELRRIYAAAPPRERSYKDEMAAEVDAEIAERRERLKQKA